MSIRGAEVPQDPIVVVTNPEEDCSPTALHAMLDHLLADAEPERETIEAAEALRGLRVDSGE